MQRDKNEKRKKSEDKILGRMDRDRSTVENETGTEQGLMRH